LNESDSEAAVVARSEVVVVTSPFHSKSGYECECLLATLIWLFTNGLHIIFNMTACMRLRIGIATCLLLPLGTMGQKQFAENANVSEAEYAVFSAYINQSFVGAVGEEGVEGVWFTNLCSGTNRIEDAGAAVRILTGEKPTTEDLLPPQQYWKHLREDNHSLAELLAVTHSPDPTGLAHRWAGIDAAIKGMWYVVGPLMGLQGGPSRFIRPTWTLEQQWMADTSLLMQMIDDWVDQDEDRGARITPVLTGQWSLQSIGALHAKTVRDLRTMLTQNGVQKCIAQDIAVLQHRKWLSCEFFGDDDSDTPAQEGVAHPLRRARCWFLRSEQRVGL
jgi:hypothetical protein